MSNMDEDSAPSAAIADTLARLPAEEREVLVLYFGIEGEEPLDVEAIAVRRSQSVHAVRRIKNSALARLRTLTRGPEDDPPGGSPVGATLRPPPLGPCDARQLPS